MKQLLSSPLFYLFFSVIVYLIFRKYHKLNTLWRIFFLGWFSISYFLLTGYGANFLVRLISLDQSDEICTSNVAVLLPSGMSRFTLDNKDFGAMTLETLNRVHAARRWLESGDNRKLIITGTETNREVSILAEYLRQLGVDSKTIEIENNSNTTYKSALNVKKLIDIDKRMVLITSQIHMRRAKMTFEKAGYAICPLVSHTQLINVKGFKAMLPEAQAIIKSEKVIHEFIGIIWYWKTDRI